MRIRLFTTLAHDGWAAGDYGTILRLQMWVGRFKIFLPLLMK
jgi:hypothetical protein